MKIINRVYKYIQSGRSWYQRETNSIKIITVHHDAIPHSNRSNDDILEQIKGIHSNKGWAGMSYHFWIGKDGSIYQINNFKDVTWHDSNNWDSIGVCVNGYFHPDYNDKPTDAQLKSLAWLLEELSTQHPEFPASFSDIRGHRERWSTACPGDVLYPLVVEYRNKQGKVNWSSSEDQESNQNMSECLISNDKEGSELFTKLVHNSEIADKVVKKLDIAEKADSVDFETIDRSINARVGNSEALKSKISGLEQEVSNRKEQVGRLEDDLRNAQQLYKDLLINQNTTQTKHEEDVRLLLLQIEQLQSKVDAEAKQKGKVLIELAECKKGVQSNNSVEIIINWIKSLWNKK